MGFVVRPTLSHTLGIISIGFGKVNFGFDDDETVLRHYRASTPFTVSQNIAVVIAVVSIQFDDPES